MGATATSGTKISTLSTLVTLCISVGFTLVFNTPVEAMWGLVCTM